jgi:hypothetical protein
MHEPFGVIQFLPDGVKGTANTETLDLPLEGLSERVLLAIWLCPCNLGSNAGQVKPLKKVF